MRTIAIAFSGLLGLATLPGLVQTAEASGRSDRPRFTQASTNIALVSDRGDRHHRGHGYYRGHGWGDRHHGWRNWHYGSRHYPQFYGGLRYYRAPSYSYVVPYPNYYVAPPVYVPRSPVYLQPSPPAYYYGSGGFNLGFNFNFHD
jgi:hypothetical protein